MRKRTNIVSFEEARKTSDFRTRRPRQNRRTGSSVDSENLSLIFKIDFEDSPSYGESPFGSDDQFAGGDLFEAAADDLNSRFSEDADLPASGKMSFFERMASKRARNKKRKAKAKAERKFAKSYGDLDSLSSSTNSNSNSVFASDSANSAPRAALYKADMGSSQRRANKLQSEKSASPLSGLSGLALPGFSLPKLSKRLISGLCVFAIFALLFGSLYAPAQNYYQQIRERDRLAAEYDALEQRNDALAKAVENLRTDEGLETKAHSDFGYVKEGEKSGSVTGIDVADSSNFRANIPPGSVPAPTTWYSGFLDIFFLYGF